MKTFIILLTALSGLVVISCKKDPFQNPERQNKHCTNEPSELTRTKYMPLKVGAYWIYQRGNMDTLENITYAPTVDYDSVYVSGDTTINGSQHFILKHSNKYYICYYGFNQSVNEVYYNTAAQYIIPFRISDDQIGDTTIVYPPLIPGYVAYEMPNYYYNMNTALGIKNGLWFEQKWKYPAGSPDYFYRYFGYEAYVENIGMTRFAFSFSSGPLNRLTYELVRYGGLD